MSTTKSQQCGWLCIKPSALQSLAKPLPFLFALCGMTLVQSMACNGYLSSINTNIEKRYGLTTSQVGYIYASYEAACICATIFISYLGPRVNRARVLGFGCILMGFGYLVFASPRFWMGSYNPKISSEKSLSQMNNHLCDSNFTNTSSPDCDKLLTESDFNWALFGFCLAELAMGLGASPLYVLGPTYLWDNLWNKRHRLYATYSAWMYVTAAVGPAVGFLLGAVFLSVWIDAPQNPPEHLTPDSDQWLGAWWLGMIIFSALQFTSSVPLLAFPKTLPEPKSEITMQKNSCKSEPTVLQQNGTTSQEPTLQQNGVASQEPTLQQNGVASQEPTLRQNGTASQEPSTILYQNGIAGKEPSITKSQDAMSEKQERPKPMLPEMKKLPQALWNLFTNPLWLFTTLLTVSEHSVITGFITYISKYLQVAFNQPASRAGIIAGGVVIPAAVGGILIGANLIRCLHLKPLRGITRLLVVLALLTTALTAALSFINCAKNTPILQGQLPRKQSQLLKCASTCNCTSEMYMPVCLQDTSYMSPCHAGCRQIITSNNFTRCSCARTEHGVPGGSVVATLNRCSGTCDALIPFLVILFVQVLLTSVGQEPSHILTLNSVPREESSFALGMQVFLQRVIAFVPAPIYFGKLFDVSCLHRDTLDKCTGGQGACLEYDLTLLPYLWLGVASAIKLLGVTFSLLTWWSASRRAAADIENEPGEMNTSQDNITTATSVSLYSMTLKPDVL